MNVHSGQDLQRDASSSVQEPLAIVGIGCRFPGGADRPDRFWRNLQNRVCAIAKVPAERMNVDTFYSPSPDAPRRSISKWAACVDRVGEFDADLFGISPREAEAMDPQQRLLLHVVWEAFEDAGISVDRVSGSNCGVVVGISMDDYKCINASVAHDIDVSHMAPGCAMSIAANRISHRLNLHGPSLSVDTACSSSLVATEIACRTLWTRDCDVAIVAGVNVILDPHVFVTFSKARMLSPSGRSLAFDARADGFVRGEGAGALLLKRLSDAEAAGDRIYAVLRSAVVNSDGWTGTLLTPNAEAQTAMLRDLCRRAEVSTSEIDYIEAHGTGTPVGDPIEASSIGQVFGQGRGNGGPAVVGSVKTNIGHLEAGAGVAGLIKAALCLHHGQFLPNAEFETVNPLIAPDELNIEIATKNKAWPSGGYPRRAVINSFGFGGTNASALLEEAPRRQAEEAVEEREGAHARLVPVSAATPAALTARARDLADYLDAGKRPKPRMADIVGTLANSRSHLSHRLALIAKSPRELSRGLRAFAEGKEAGYREESPPRLVRGRRLETPRLAFAFSGQGSQWPRMARRLLAHDRLFRASVEEVDRLVRQLAGWSVIEEIGRPRRSTRIDQTAITQSCIFAVQVGLLRRWRAWGVEADLIFGHSLGEIAAAYAAGALSLEDAVTVVHYRSVLQAETEGSGAIVAVGLSAEAMQAQLLASGESDVEIAAYNSDEMVTIAGEKTAVDRVLKQVKQDVGPQLFLRRVRMNFAPHSPQMDPIRERFLESLSDIAPQATRVPLVSTVTGEEIAGQALDASYWWNNIRRPVLFQIAVQTAMEMGTDLYLEIGPDSPLSGLIATCTLELGKQASVVRSQRRGQNDFLSLQSALGDIYVSGAKMNWEAVAGRGHRRLALPSYPSELKSYWIDEAAVERNLRPPSPHPLLGQRLDTAQPTWENVLSLKERGYLKGHKVNGNYLFPAAGYIEMMIAVSRALFGEGPIELQDLELVKANFLNPEQSEIFQTTFDSDRRRIVVRSRPSGGDEPWEVKAFVTVVTANPESTVPALPPQPDDPGYAFSEKAFYKSAAEGGYDYDGLFKGVKAVSVKDDALWASLKLPKKVVSGDDYSYHPAMLDSVLQSGIGFLILPDKVKSLREHNVMLLPRSARRLRFFRPPSARMQSYCRRVATNALSFRTDTTLCDAKGRPVLEFEGYLAIAMRRADARREESGALPRYFCDEMHRADVPSDAGRKEVGLWLIFADGQGIAEETARRLRADGNRCVLVDAGDGFGGVHEDRAELDPRRPEDFIALMREIAALGEDLVGTLFLWPCDRLHGAHAQSAETLAQAQSHVTTPALHLVQAMIETSSYQGELFFVTRGARVLSEEGSAANPLALSLAPLVGFARTTFSEVMALRSAVIDLDPAQEDPTVQARLLTQEVLAVEATRETDVAYRGESRFVARFLSRAQASLKPKRAPALSSRGSVGYALSMREPGDLDDLAVTEARHSPPRAGKVSVSVRAVGLNFRDVMAATGLLPFEAEAEPAFLNLGLECAGIVEAVGEGVTRLKVGDPVVATAIGCFKSSLVLPEAAVWATPANQSPVEAATLMSAFSTAYYALVTMGRLRKGERVLIHLGTGGVGLAAIQIAQMIGAEIFSTAGSPRKRDHLRALGIRHVMDSRSLDFADEVLETTGGRGVDVILNALPGEAIERGLSILAPCGRFLEIGKRDIYADTALGLKVMRKNISFFAIDMARMGEDNPSMMGEIVSEISRLMGEGRLRPLPAEVYPLNRVTEAFERMAKGQHIGKVVITLEPEEVEVALDDATPARFEAEGAYLVTGGVGGFGLAVAVWLARHGAGHLYLVSLSGTATKATEEGLRQIEAAGAKATILAADMAKRDHVARVVGRIAADGLTLRGVIHAAVVYDDALIPRLDESRMARVLAPKMQGSWNLHDATKNMALDFFVLFSSIAAPLGNFGQANYAAANFFQESLARYRQALGLPGLAISWGALDGAGQVARSPELQKFFESSGTPAIPLDLALSGLGVMLRKGEPVVSYAAIDWEKFALVNGHVCAQPRIVGSRSGTDSSSGDRRAYQEVMAAPKRARPAILARYVTEAIARVLKVDHKRIDADMPLQELGLDSLTGFQLKNRTETEFGVSLQVSAFLQSPTVTKLADAVAKALESEKAAQETGSAEAGSGAALSVRQEAVLAEYDQQTEKEAYLRSFEFGAAMKVSPRIGSVLSWERGEGIIKAHSLLQTCFPRRKGRRGVAISEAVEAVSAMDCRAMSEEAFGAFLLEQANLPFDLERGPLFRAQIFQRPDDCDVLLARAHGVILDGFSFLIALELMGAGFLSGLGDLSRNVRRSLPYSEFAAWQSRFMASPKGRTQLLYWKRKLAEPAERLALPYDHERLAMVPLGAGTRVFTLDRRTTDRLRRIARAEHRSLFSLLTTLYALTLSRYASRREVLISTTASGRTRSEFEATLGPLSNSITLRIPLDPAASGRDSLAVVDQDLKDSLSNQDYPASLVKKELGLSDWETAALDQVSFSMFLPQGATDNGATALFANLPGSRLEIGRYSAETLALPPRGCRRDLSGLVLEHDGKIVLRFDYDASLFEASTIDALGGRYKSVAAAFARDPLATVASLAREEVARV